MRRLARRSAPLVAAALLLSACSSTPATTPASSVATSAASGGASVAPSDAIADLRTKLNGQKLKVGTSASANPAITGAVHTVRYLKDTFGVDVELRQLDSDPLVAAVISSSVDVGQLSLAGTAAGKARGADFLAFAGDDQPNPYYVVGRAPIKSLEEVRGQAFGATENLSQITGQTATACLKSVGIDIKKDVKLLQLANTGAVAEALRSGQIVAGLTAPHRMAPIIADEGADKYNVLCVGKDVAPQQNNVWMAKRSWVDSHPDMALAFAIASIDTGRWAHSDKEGWISLALEAAPDYKRPAVEAIYATYVEQLDLWPINGSLDRSLCDATLKSSLDSGALDSPMKCDDVVRFDFQDKALDILGKK
jgi:sulfonate transport system substrate-binding protein